LTLSLCGFLPLYLHPVHELPAFADPEHHHLQIQRLLIHQHPMLYHHHCYLMKFHKLFAMSCLMVPQKKDDTVFRRRFLRVSASILKYQAIRIKQLEKMP
jgi:hypothetical protein